jgi:2-haloacid dehalogenase
MRRDPSARRPHPTPHHQQQIYFTFAKEGMKPEVIVFDLVETLLDLSALDSAFREAFGAARLRREWFSEILKMAFAITTAGDWVAFARIAEAALKVIEERQERKLSWFQRRRILALMRKLPPFPDVRPALEELKAAGFRLAVLTNSSVKSAEEALKRGQVRNLFDKVLSADRVKRLKPAPEPYRMAAKELGTKPGKILFVAAHAWDIRGAHRAGLRTCFLRRSGQVLDELAPDPQIIISDLRELANAL